MILTTRSSHQAGFQAVAGPIYLVDSHFAIVRPAWVAIIVVGFFVSPGDS